MVVVPNNDLEEDQLISIVDQLKYLFKTSKNKDSEMFKYFDKFLNTFIKEFELDRDQHFFAIRKEDVSCPK